MSNVVWIAVVVAVILVLFGSQLGFESHVPLLNILLAIAGIALLLNVMTGGSRA